MKHTFKVLGPFKDWKKLSSQSPAFSQCTNASHETTVKGELLGGNNPLYKWTTSSFCNNVSFIAPSVPFTSTAITLLSLMIVLSLFYADLNDTCQSSIPNWHLGLRKNLHSPRITALRLRTRIIIISCFLRPNTKVEISFPLWFQRNLAKIKQREQYKNYSKGCYRMESKYCYGNVQEKLK